MTPLAYKEVYQMNILKEKRIHYTDNYSLVIVCLFTLVEEYEI